MFHHIVQLGFSRALTATDHEFIELQCDLLKQRISGLNEIQFVANESDRTSQFSHAFVTAFTDSKAHDLYQMAPEHLALRDLINALKAHMAVLDYTT